MSEQPSLWSAMAAMALNRVIGHEGRIPWHLPEDFKFFKQMTTGHVLVMGRKTFQSIGRPLPDRHTLVLSRQPARETEIIPQQDLFRVGTFEVIESPAAIDRVAKGRRVFICGGTQVYAELMPRCGELYLTRVRREVAGDACFPRFEHLFDFAEIVRETPEFGIERWLRKPGSPDLVPL